MESWVRREGKGKQEGAEREAQSGRSGTWKSEAGGRRWGRCVWADTHAALLIRTGDHPPHHPFNVLLP